MGTWGCFHPHWWFLINISATGKGFFPDTWDLSPTGIGEILKSNYLLQLQPHFQRVLMWKTIKNPKSHHFVYVKLAFSYDRNDKLPNFRTTDNLKTIMKSYWRPKYWHRNMQKCIVINCFRIFTRLGQKTKEKMGEVNTLAFMSLLKISQALNS